MNSRPGRLCLLHWNFEEKPLETSKFLFHSLEEAIEQIHRIFSYTLSVQSSFKRLGICPYSYPLNYLTKEALELFEITHSSDLELRLFPYPTLSYWEQPNLFFETRAIILDEKAKIRAKELETRAEMLRNVKNKLPNP